MEIFADDRIAANGLELRGHVYDVYRSQGYFPIMKRNGLPIKVLRQPIWPSGIGQIPSFILHHPNLIEWPRVALIYNASFGGYQFRVLEWKQEGWCKVQSEYVWESSLHRVMISRRSIADDPMRLANLAS